MRPHVHTWFYNAHIHTEERMLIQFNQAQHKYTTIQCTHTYKEINNITQHIQIHRITHTSKHTPDCAMHPNIHQYTEAHDAAKHVEIHRIISLHTAIRA